MKTGEYLPDLSRGARVQVIGQDKHPKNRQSCIIIGALPNPSKQAQHQWYDVRFDDGVIGRFLERYLVKIDADGKQNAA